MKGKIDKKLENVGQDSRHLASSEKMVSSSHGTATSWVGGGASGRARSGDLASRGCSRCRRAATGGEQGGGALRPASEGCSQQPGTVEEREDRAYVAAAECESSWIR